MVDSWADANAYEAYVGRWSREIARHFLDWLNLPTGLRWLDLGSGPGTLSDQVLRGFEPRSVVGVEPSDQFRRAAKENIQDTRAVFRAGHGEAIPLGDGEVECVISGLVLNFIPDKAGAMHEMIRCVTPGGTVAAYVWDYAGHVQFMRYFWDAAVALNPEARELDEGIRFPICRPGPLRELFEAAGLQDVRTRAIDIPTAFEDFDDYWQPFLSGVGPAPGYCAALDEASQTTLKRRLRAALPTDPDGMILLAARAWAVKGTRPSAKAS
jgi:SAM-dependent methyltransferase